MARQRKSNTNNTEGGTKMAGLTAEEIKALLGKTRQKGLYVERLNTFVESGEMGVNVNEQWVDFADKKATTLKQGFEGAKDKKEFVGDAEQIKVVASEDKVFLINLAVAGAELGEQLVAAAAA